MSEIVSLTPIVNFVAYDEEGRITEASSMERRFYDERCARGDRVLLANKALQAVPASQTLYVAQGVLKDRPIFDRDFDNPEVPVSQETVLKNVPSCTYSFVGPIRGTQVHSTGDLSIGFTIPGTYTLSFEAFPYLPVTRQIKVLPKGTSS